MNWSTFSAPAGAAFLAGLVIAGLAVAAEPDEDLAHHSAHLFQIIPSPVEGGPVKIEPQPVVVPDDSGIPGVVAWDTRGWPGDRKPVPGALPYDHHQGPVRYAVTPPAGGDHYPVWANCGVYDKPIPNEKGVHAHEHGAVWITYRPDLPHHVVEVLEEFVRHQPLVTFTIKGAERRTDERYILMSPFPGLPAPIVISSWAHQLRLESASDPRLQRYVDTFRTNPKYSPEYGPTCEGQPEKLSGRPIFK